MSCIVRGSAECSNPDAVTKIVNALSIRVAPRDLRSKDTRNLLTIIMQQWLPLSTATFQAIVDIIPPPDVAQSQRIPFMLHPERARESSTPLSPTNPIEEALYACKQDGQVVAYVSKMFAVNRGDLPEHRPKELTAEEMRQRGRQERERRAALAAGAGNGIEMDGIEGLTETVEKLDLQPEPESSEVLLAFSRVFSGTIERGIELVATLPKYDPSLGADHPRNAQYIVQVTASELYMMMGRDLVAVDSVPAGHVCAIGGLEGKVHRNATLCGSVENMVNLAGVTMQAAPIVRVALEPENPSDMPKLVRGLQILNQADPCAEYFVQETGEHVILTAGELHLEVGPLCGNCADCSDASRICARDSRNARFRNRKLSCRSEKRRSKPQVRFAPLANADNKTWHPPRRPVLREVRSTEASSLAWSRIQSEPSPCRPKSPSSSPPTRPPWPRCSRPSRTTMSRMRRAMSRPPRGCWSRSSSGKSSKFCLERLDRIGQMLRTASGRLDRNDSGRISFWTRLEKTLCGKKPL